MRHFILDVSLTWIKRLRSLPRHSKYGKIPHLLPFPKSPNARSKVGIVPQRGPSFSFVVFTGFPKPTTPFVRKMGDGMLSAELRTFVQRIHEDNSDAERTTEMGEIERRDERNPRGEFDELVALMNLKPTFDQSWLRKSWRSDLKDFADRQIQNSSVDVERKEAVHARKVLGRDSPVRPRSFLDAIVDDAFVANLLEMRSAWLDVWFPLETYPFVSFRFTASASDARQMIWVEFTSSKPLKPGFRKTTGIDTGRRFMVPTMEFLGNLAKTAKDAGFPKREFFDIINQGMWGIRRELVFFLYRFLDTFANASVKESSRFIPIRKVHASEIRSILQRHKAPYSCWAALEDMCGATTCELVWDVHDTTEEQAEQEEFPGMEWKLAEDGGRSRQEKETGTLQAREPMEVDDQKELITMLLEEDSLTDLLIRSPINPHTGRNMRKGYLVKNIVSVDKWSNPRHPTSMVESALRARRDGAQGWEVARAIFNDLLSPLSPHASIEHRVRKLKKTSWVEGEHPEFFHHGLLGQLRIDDVHRRILEPLELVVVPVSGEGHLCMVRTFAFWIFWVHEKLPPFTWRLTACLAFCATFLLGSKQYVENAKVVLPSSKSLDDAIFATCAGSARLFHEHSEVVQSIVCGNLYEREEGDLRVVLNASLRDLVLKFFAKHNAEKSSHPFSFDGGIEYEALQIIPVLTRRPLIVIRTLGSVFDNGKLNEMKCVERNTIGDEVAVFDVFACTEDGTREVCTYGSYREAQQGLGRGTPYVAFWTGLEGGISHIDPVITTSEYERLQSCLK